MMTIQPVARINHRSKTIKLSSSHDGLTETLLAAARDLLLKTSLMTKPVTRPQLVELRKDLDPAYVHIAFLLNTFAKLETSVKPEELHGFELNLNPILGVYSVSVNYITESYRQPFTLKIHPADGKNLFLRKLLSPVKDTALDNHQVAIDLTEFL